MRKNKRLKKILELFYLAAWVVATGLMLADVPALLYAPFINRVVAGLGLMMMSLFLAFYYSASVIALENQIKQDNAHPQGKYSPGPKG